MGGDSLVIWMSNGFQGTEIHARRDKGGFVGQAHAFTDSNPHRLAEWQVTGHRAQCLGL